MALQALSNQVVPARESHIAETHNRLSNVLDENTGLIQELEKKLSAVLRQEPTGCGEQGKDVASYVPLAEALRSLSGKAMGQQEMLSSILRRIEL